MISPNGLRGLNSPNSLNSLSGPGITATIGATKTNETNRPTFALLGHPANYRHLADIVRRLMPGFEVQNLDEREAALVELLENTPSFAAGETLTIDPAGGGQLTGRLVICTFFPEMLDSPRKMLAAYQKTRDGCRLARDMGAKIVGLGGFTSIVAGAAGEQLARELGIAVTSGNSLTAALALEQLCHLLDRLGWDLGQRTLAVLGASGDIGQACTLALAPRVRRLILIARNKARLETLRAELPPGVETTTTVDVEAAIEADVIVAATSAPRPILAESSLRPGAIVCDLGYPETLSRAPQPRPDVLAFSGGLAEMPFTLDLGGYTRLPAPSLLYGCFSETITLAMAGRYENYSTGRGQITLEKMREILALARTCGFRPAPLYRGGKLVTDRALETFLGTWEKRGTSHNSPFRVS